MKTLKKITCLSLVACSICFGLTGCGTSKKTSTSGNNTTATTEKNNVVEDAAENVGNAAEDVTNGVGNAVEDLVGANGFENYNDAHDYFLQTMGNYHSDAKFEIRDEDRNLADYQEGSKGYHFYLYDTSKNNEGELFGEFYVDATSGTIFQKDANGNFTEYRGTTANETTTKNGATSGTNTTNTNGTNTGTTNGNNATNGTTSNSGTTTTNGGNVSSAK